MVEMNVRVAKGSELPKGWHPGQPLPVGRRTHLRPAQTTGCPFGPQCYSCRNGLLWNPARGRHTVQSGHTGRKLTRRSRRAA
jgi:hypothetical protein